MMLSLAFITQSHSVAAVEIEPNNPCLEPQIIEGMTTPPFGLNGSLETPPHLPDIDFFQFTSEAGIDLIAQLKGADSGVGTLPDLVLGLFDSSCNLLSHNDDFGTLDSLIRFTVPDDGIFVLAVGSSCDDLFIGTGDSAGTYELTISEDTGIDPGVQFLASVLPGSGLHPTASLLSGTPRKRDFLHPMDDSFWPISAG